MVRRLTQIGTAALIALSVAAMNGCRSDLGAGSSDASIDSTRDATDADAATADAPVQCDGSPCTYTLTRAYPSDPFLIAHTSLECLCATDSWLNGCPAATLSEALALIGSADVLSCAPSDVCPLLVRGCGVVSVGRDGLGGFLWHYDEATGDLIGAGSWDDVPSGPCGAIGYGGGVGPNCPTATRCNPCPNAVPNDTHVGYCEDPCP